MAINIYTCINRGHDYIYHMQHAYSGLQVTHNGNNVIGSTLLVFTVNSAQTISCSTDLDVIRLEWMRAREVVESSSNQQLDLVFDPVNDTIHNQEYTCVAISPYGSQEQTFVLRSEGDYRSSIL